MSYGKIYTYKSVPEFQKGFVKVIWTDPEREISHGSYKISEIFSFPSFSVVSCGVLLRWCEEARLVERLPV